MLDYWSRNSYRFRIDPTSIDRFLLEVNPLLHHQMLHSWSCGTESTKPETKRFALLYHAPPPPFALSANSPANSPLASDLPDNSIVPSNTEVPIVIDTGASWAVAPRLKDFVTSIEPAIDSLRSLNGSINLYSPA
jgi:hypothetical protein